MDDKQSLTELQARILEFIRDEIRSSGRSPTMREIQAAFGYQSPHTAQFHVNKLIKAGHLRRGEGHRALQLVRPSGLRLVGTVAAGSPIEAIEERDEHIDLAGFEDDGHFALKVRGESMIEECIADGDHVVVRKQTTCTDGELVVARIGEEATLKRFYHERKQSRIRLQPANSTMKPIFCRAEDVTIEGVVVGVIRLMEPRK
jgi:repressor LexA